MCALSDRARVACRPETRRKERKKRGREREGQPSPAARRKGRGCVCARAGRGEERDAAPMLLGPEPRVRGEGGGVSRGQSFAPPPPAPNNLLVFHVRFDSLSFRYLYLPGPLRISGISGISRAWGLGRRREEGGGERKKEKIKGGKKRNGVHTREVGRAA